MENTRQIKHLLSRAGFGMRFEDMSDWGHLSADRAVKKLFDAAPSAPLDTVKQNADYAMVLKGDVLARKMFLQDQRQQEKDLNISWINKLVSTDAILQEK